jgi:hypothetical protein
MIMVNPMTRHLVPLLAICLLPLAGGCEKDEQMRIAAETLAADVERHHDEQRRRVDELNRGYRETFKDLINEHAALDDDERRQARQADHQRLADRLLVDWETETLPSRVIASFDEDLDAQRQRIEAGEAALAAARAAYAAAYRDASLELSRLRRVQSSLRALARAPESQRDLVQLFSVIAAAYRQARAAADETPEGGAE